MRIRFLLSMLLLALAWSGSANAASAYTAPGGTNLREGPGANYPVVASVRGGSDVEVLGCLQDFSWCETLVENERGWISSRRLEYMHAGQRVPLWSFYTYFNTPTIPFRGGSYRHRDRDRPTQLDCRDPNVDCQEEPLPPQGPVECESCPWPTGRAP
jgi:uncharacterized protein YraI